MSTTNIILWSSSLSIGVIGLLFGIIASVNAAKANNKIQDIITSTFATEEAHKLFFENIKKVILINRKAVRTLKNQKETSYIEYTSVSAEGRLIPISNHYLKIINETEFKDIATTYTNVKSDFDNAWFKIIKDTSVLVKDKPISKIVSEKLIEYHNAVISTCSVILKNYSGIISNSIDLNKNK